MFCRYCGAQLCDGVKYCAQCGRPFLDDKTDCAEAADEVIEVLYRQFCIAHCVTTDSRAITPGCIFFAFKGATFDGNAFAAEALRQGAAYCVISDPRYAVDARCLVVPDVLQAIQQLAVRYRKDLTIPVVGITGTNGKTTTKELVRDVLRRRYRVHATTGNLNNHLGVPLTLLATPADAEIAIVEMGANHPGEIAQLCGIANPTMGLITNVGKAHLEGFGSLQGVLETKTALYRHLAANDGTVFVNACDSLLCAEVDRLCDDMTTPSVCYPYQPPLPSVSCGEHGLHVVTYGDTPEADVKGSNLNGDPYMRFYFEDGDNVYTVDTQLVGGYNFNNAMAAVAVGAYFGVEMFDIKEALQQYRPANNRSQFVRTRSNNLYLDCYNANYSSMNAALDAFLGRRLDKKVVILGSMYELGDESAALHDEIVKRLVESDVAKAYLVGGGFARSVDDERFLFFDTTSDLHAALSRMPIANANILVKGSNANKLWTLQEVL